MIEPLVDSANGQQVFKYVQVRREKIQTWFKKHDVIQMIDISQKVLYEMALGEKRLFSLINATVSHEMRNPTNSIISQVQEQKRLNSKFRAILENMSVNTFKQSKKQIEKNLLRQEDSTSMQVSASKILNFLINDMLDYA